MEHNDDNLKVMLDNDVCIILQVSLNNAWNIMIEKMVKKDVDALEYYAYDLIDTIYQEVEAGNKKIIINISQPLMAYLTSKKYKIEWFIKYVCEEISEIVQ